MNTFSQMLEKVDRRLNAGISSMDSAILFGTSEEIVLQSFSEKSQEQRKDLRPNTIFQHKAMPEAVWERSVGRLWHP